MFGADMLGGFSPLTIFGNDIRLFDRGDTRLSLTGANIDQWSGKGPAWTGAGATRPTKVYVDGAGTSGRWNGTTTNMLAGSDISSVATDYVGWCVFKANSTGVNPRAILDAYNGGASRLILAHVDGPGLGNVSFYDGAWRQVAPAALGLQILIWYLVAGVGTAKVYRDFVQIGANQDYNAQPIATGGGGGIALGSHFSGGFWHLDGDIREIGLAVNPSVARLNMLRVYSKWWYNLG